MKTKLIFAGLAALAGIHTMNAQNASQWNNASSISGVNCSGFGFQALRNNNTSATANTGLGCLALYNNTTGNTNTAGGTNAMFANTTGSGNTAMGARSLFQNTGAWYNAAFGDGALYSTQVDGNSAFGHNSLFNNTYGLYNSAHGFRSLFSNTTGSGNTAVGNDALYTNNANDNTATGNYALFSNASGNNNTAAGSNALYSNDASDNTATGFNAMYSNVNGANNTAAGSGALYANNSNNNTATGYNAMYSNNTGYDNTAAGFNSLYSNVSGQFNAAFGSEALFSNVAYNNTAMGYQAMNQTTGGHDNAAVGYQALVNSQAGKYCVAVGANALTNNVNETDNTAVGWNADITSGSGVTNSGVFGTNAIVNAANKIRIGNAAITVIEGQVMFTTSDGRFKTDIREDDVKGLEFIKKLRPVVYNFDSRKFTDFLTKNMPEEKRKLYMGQNFEPATKIRQSGFIAQEVEKAAKEAGYNFSGVHAPESDGDNYSIAYSQLVVPLVKAVQEQQKMIEDLQQQLAAQSGNNQASGNATGIRDINSITGFSMEQNIPNPFTHETVVNYNLPQTVNSAYMAVYDLTGKQLTTFPITQKGASSVTITSDKLAAGIYIYSIVGDGTILDSKRMVVADNK